MAGSGHTTSGLAAVAAVAVLALVAGCSSSGSSGAPASHGAQAGSAAADLQSRSTAIGTVLVDTSGHTVYELAGESPSNPTCTGACLSVWPAVTADGHQVVVHGHLAYTFVGDKAAGQTSGQNLKDRWGLWLALGPSGDPITGSGSGSSTPSAPSTPASSSKAPGGGGPAF